VYFNAECTISAGKQEIGKSSRSIPEEAAYRLPRALNSERKIQIGPNRKVAAKTKIALILLLFKSALNA
jgi:hypothetical protein